jgi:hypothetical protein
MVTKYFSSALFLAAIFFVSCATVPPQAFAQKKVPAGILKQVEKTVNERKQGKLTPSPTPISSSSAQTATQSGVVDTLPTAKVAKEEGVSAQSATEPQEKILARYLDNTFVVWKDEAGQLFLTIHWTRQLRYILLIIVVTLPFLLFWKKALRLFKRKRRFKVKRIEL